MSASNKVLDKEYLRISNNFDVMELELMAIFIELRIDVVYKDNLEYSIYSFVEIGNDMADALSKMSLENNDNSEIFISINDEVI
ncbi:20080_t:CDS:2 [Rhizophagus irregularis]|nr:20080_t:CDS:2 [Rhizophagus irregularis]